MEGTVLQLFVKEEKGKPPKPVGCRMFDKSEDIRQVSILSEETVQKMQEARGLCTRKYVPNIVVGGMSLHELEIGSEIHIGDAVLAITQTGKECFPECGLYQNGAFCALKFGCVFAKVLKGGEAKTGDAVCTAGV